MSSRHEFEAKEVGYTVAVGWDNPLMSFFATVYKEMDKTDEEADDNILFWIGTMSGEIPKPEGLVDPLRPYFDVTTEIIATLKADRMADIDREPTPFQRSMLRTIGGT